MTGDQVRNLRKTLGYTQARLADELGVTPNTVARYERDDFKPSPPVMKLLKLLVQTGASTDKPGAKAPETDNLGAERRAA